MKIRSMTVIRILAFFVAMIIRLWVGSFRIHYRPRGRGTLPGYHEPGEKFIYAFWHEALLLLVYQCSCRQSHVLISEHADGELIAQVCRHMRFQTVRGSTTRNSLKALRELVRAAEKGHIGITPDGPRGPRRKVQPGVIYLAARSGLPIVPIGCGFSKARRMNSWDRFALPYPGTAAWCVTAEPIHVPAKLSSATLEEYRLMLENALDDVTREAECLAGKGRYVPRESEVSQARSVGDGC
jgi:lysophospholipid acyltransferase (LPLAT)-like uncharacterized protein